MEKAYNLTESIIDVFKQGVENNKETIDVIKIILIVADVIILLFSLIGNSLVIHIVRTRVNIRKNPFNWLLVNTAIADLVDVITASAFSLPYFLCGECWFSGVLGTILCKLIPFFVGVSICVAVWTLTVIAAYQYRAVVSNQKKAMSSKSVVHCIVTVWFFAGVLLSVQLYKFKVKTEHEVPRCYEEWYEDSEELSSIFNKAEMIARVVITYAVPLIIIAFLYLEIANFLSRHKPPGNLSLNRQAFVKQAKKRRAAIKMMMTAVTVFAVCWLPVHVSHTMSEFHSDAYNAIPTFFQWLFDWLAHANAAIHPWLFIAFGEQLRLETMGIFRNIRKVNQLRVHAVSLPNLFTRSVDISAPNARRRKKEANVAVHTVWCLSYWWSVCLFVCLFACLFVLYQPYTTMRQFSFL